MTRINLGISVKSLTDQHLLAEHREIKRLCTLYRNWDKNQASVPVQFSLGTGHMKFFLDKGLYTYERYRMLHTECLERRFSVEDYRGNWGIYQKQHYNDYHAIPEETELLVERISERILASKQTPRYYGENIEKSFAILLLKENL